MRKGFGFALILIFALQAASASKENGTSALRDVQPAGTTDKKHKHQQFDLSLSTTSGTEYTCRTNEKDEVKATDFVVGSNVTYEFKDNKGKLKSSAGKKVDCTVVRVANASASSK
jgi:hypothetical protein